MNKRTLRRLCAAMLALVLLAATAGLAEAGLSLDAQTEPDALALPDAGIEPSGIVEFDAGAIDEALNDISPELAEPSDSAALLPLEASEAPEPAEGEPVIPREIELGIREKYALAPEGAAEGGLTYKSSKPEVATVSKKGVITGRARGYARIKCLKDNKLLGVCLVRVLKAPKKVSLGPSPIAIGVRETVQLEPVIDKGARTAFTWSVKDGEVLRVSEDGQIKGLKPGKTVVTVKTLNGLRAWLTVKVASAPRKLKLNEASLTLEKGNTFRLEAILPEQTASHAITWGSSDEGVATVDAQGTVTAVAKGSARITATAFNGREAACDVSVINGPFDEDPDVAYRALLIGQSDFYTPLRSTESDVILMAKMLRTVHGLRGADWQVTKEFNLSRDGVLKAIRQTFGKAGEEDVSLFFISTHGVSDPEASDTEAGALCMIPDTGNHLLLIRDLAKALGRIPGKVIVLIDACGSGATIHAQEDEDTTEAKVRSAQRFTQSVANAFMQADPSLRIRANTGELRVENKFYVLTACDYQENSVCIEGLESYGYFTKWLTDGVGRSGRMQADANKDGRVTLEEMYRHIAKIGNKHPMTDETGGIFYQHVQVYPQGSDFVMFKR